MLGEQTPHVLRIYTLYGPYIRQKIPSTKSAGVLIIDIREHVLSIDLSMATEEDHECSDEYDELDDEKQLLLGQTGDSMTTLQHTALDKITIVSNKEAVQKAIKEYVEGPTTYVAIPSLKSHSPQAVVSSSSVPPIRTRKRRDSDGRDSIASDVSRSSRSSIVDGLLFEIYDRFNSGYRRCSFDDSDTTFTEYSSTSDTFTCRSDSVQLEQQSLQYQRKYFQGKGENTNYYLMCNYKTVQIRPNRQFIF